METAEVDYLAEIRGWISELPDDVVERLLPVELKSAPRAAQDEELTFMYEIPEGLLPMHVPEMAKFRVRGRVDSAANALFNRTPEGGTVSWRALISASGVPPLAEVSYPPLSAPSQKSIFAVPVGLGRGTRRSSTRGRRK